MPKKLASKSKALPKYSSTKLLTNVLYESGFHFFTAVGNYTGITATNLNEFATKLQIVPVESVDFHFQRKDFQKWVAGTIGDKELAETTSIFGSARSAEDLRREIVRTVQERLAELARFSAANENVMIRAAIPLQN